MKEKTLRTLLMILPAIAVALYILVHVIVYQKPLWAVILVPYYSERLVLVYFVSLLPFAIHEYRMYKHILCVERETPVFLSILEANITAGKAFFQSIEYGADSTKCLGKHLGYIIRRVAVGENFNNLVDEYIPSESFLLRVFKEYIKLLSLGGEELFQSIPKYRRVFDTVLRLRKSLISLSVNLYVVSILILATLAFISGMIVKLFLAKYVGISVSTEIMNVTPLDVDIVKTVVSYIIAIMVTTTAVALSSLTGLRRQSYLIKTTPIGLIIIILFILYL